MRLLFVGHQPAETLGRRLVKSGFQLYRDRLPAGSPSADLVVFRIKTNDTASDVEKNLIDLRIDHPAAWLVALATRRKLADTEFCRSLLECVAHDDVWTVGSWEALFWFNLARAQREQALRLELKQTHALSPELSETRDESEALVRKLEEDVALASHIQQSFLPKRFPTIAGVQLAAKYLPSNGVGGDYYDIFEFGDRKRYGILLADSKTHGMAAALLTALLKVRLEEMKDRFPDSRSLIQHLHTELQQLDVKEHASLSVLYGILDRGKLTFQFTAAGHLSPLLWRAGKPEPQSFTPVPALGVHRDNILFPEYVLQLQPGDLLFLHTDGLNRVVSSADLQKMLHEAGKLPDPNEVQAELLGRLDRARASAPLTDDVTIVQLAVGARALYLSRKQK